MHDDCAGFTRRLVAGVVVMLGAVVLIIVVPLCAFIALAILDEHPDRVLMADATVFTILFIIGLSMITFGLRALRSAAR